MTDPVFPAFLPHHPFPEPAWRQEDGVGKMKAARCMTAAFAFYEAQNLFYQSRMI
jgi:hypothetical protein